MPDYGRIDEIVEPDADAEVLSASDLQMLDACDDANATTASFVEEEGSDVEEEDELGKDLDPLL